MADESNRPAEPGDETTDIAGAVPSDGSDPAVDDHPRALPDQGTCARGEDEDDDGYDPWSDRRPAREPLYEQDPWS
jgi:hypothetical protein